MLEYADSREGIIVSPTWLFMVVRDYLILTRNSYMPLRFPSQIFIVWNFFSKNKSSFCQLISPLFFSFAEQFRTRMTKRYLALSWFNVRPLAFCDCDKTRPDDIVERMTKTSPFFPSYSNKCNLLLAFLRCDGGVFAVHWSLMNGRNLQQRQRSSSYSRNRSKHFPSRAHHMSFSSFSDWMIFVEECLTDLQSVFEIFQSQLMISHCFVFMPCTT